MAEWGLSLGSTSVVEEHSHGKSTASAPVIAGNVVAPEGHALDVPSKWKCPEPRKPSEGHVCKQLASRVGRQRIKFPTRRVEPYFQAFLNRSSIAPQ